VKASSKNALEHARQKLETMTPAPMHSMMQKEPRDVAIKKQHARKNLVVENVPPTTSGTV
jgi:hypothetical protein